MTVIISDNSVAFAYHVDIQQIVDGLEEHISRLPNTSEVEELGRRLNANGYACEAVEELVKEVCRWGNHAGILSVLPSLSMLSKQRVCLLR